VEPSVAVLGGRLSGFLHVGVARCSQFHHHTGVPTQTNRKILGAAAFSLALAGGGVAGAVLGTPSLSSAQDETTETTAAESGTPRLDHRGAGLTAAAEAVGISEDDLRTALEDGQSIAQVAETNDVDVQTVIDAMVAEATARIEATLAELPDRITDLVNREGLPERNGPGEGGFGGGGPGGPGERGPGLNAAAEAIGITVEDLRTAVREGDTIADVAAANDVDVQTVIDALVAEATTRVDAAVANGELTEAKAVERKADLVEHITAMVNGERPEGFGSHGPPDAA